MNRKRPKQIVIRLSEEEYQKVKDKIEKTGMKQQEYLIRAILNKPVINTEGLKEILPELKRQGNNLNQIARKLNENGYVDYKNGLLYLPISKIHFRTGEYRPSKRSL